MLRQMFEQAKRWFSRQKKQKSLEVPYQFKAKATDEPTEVSWMDCRTKLVKYRRHRNTIRKIQHESRRRNHVGV